MKMLSAYGGLFLLIILFISSNFSWSRGCLAEEKRAIQEILNSISYQSTSSLSDSFTDDCCQWEGVDCSRTSSHVVRIFFDSLGEEEDVVEVEGLWNPDMNLFAQLKELQELQLTRNRISRLLNPEGESSLFIL